MEVVDATALVTANRQARINEKIFFMMFSWVSTGSSRRLVT